MSIGAIPETMATLPNGEALYEVVNGVFVELPPMSVYATLLTTALGAFVGPFVRQHRLGRTAVECLFILDEVTDLRRRPDFAFVSAERWPLDRAIPTTGDWAVIPDLAVEVQSPNDTLKEIQAKMYEYFARGVRQYWLIIPETRTMYIYDSTTQVRILTEADTIENTIVPGFALKLAELFQ